MPCWLRLALPALLLPCPLPTILYAQASQPPHQVADFKYVRFHGILDDEVAVYNEDQHGNTVYNFSYVEEIYDGLLVKGSIQKSSYYDFGLLHQLGDRPIATDAKNLIVTKSPDGTLTLAAWNLVDPTPFQVVQLNQETALGPPAQTQLHDGKLTLQMTPNAQLLIKVQP
jgi:beta-xylosidase